MRIRSVRFKIVNRLHFELLFYNWPGMPCWFSSCFWSEVPSLSSPNWWLCEAVINSGFPEKTFNISQCESTILRHFSARLYGRCIGCTCFFPVVTKAIKEELNQSKRSFESTGLNYGNDISSPTNCWTSPNFLYFPVASVLYWILVDIFIWKGPTSGLLWWTASQWWKRSECHSLSASQAVQHLEKLVVIWSVCLLIADVWTLLNIAHRAYVRCFPKRNWTIRDEDLLL